MWTKRFK